MSNCDEYIVKVYTDERINTFIKKLHPKNVQDDLRQELAMVLLNYDCDRIVEMSSLDKLSGFAFKIVWNMVTQKRNKFYKTFIQSNVVELDNFQLSEQNDNKDELIELAEKFFDKKREKNANELHEFYIFEKYLEFDSQIMVAKYFDIPTKHVSIVINNVKKNLKKQIKQCL